MWQLLSHMHAQKGTALPYSLMPLSSTVTSSMDHSKRLGVDCPGGPTGACAREAGSCALRVALLTFGDLVVGEAPVSYTHLTLPTILLV